MTFKLQMCDFFIFGFIFIIFDHVEKLSVKHFLFIWNWQLWEKTFTIVTHCFCFRMSCCSKHLFTTVMSVCCVHSFEYSHFYFRAKRLTVQTADEFIVDNVVCFRMIDKFYLFIISLCAMSIWTVVLNQCLFSTFIRFKGPISRRWRLSRSRWSWCLPPRWRWISTTTAAARRIRTSTRRFSTPRPSWWLPAPSWWRLWWISTSRRYDYNSIQEMNSILFLCIHSNWQVPRVCHQMLSVCSLLSIRIDRVKYRQKSYNKPYRMEKVKISPTDVASCLFVRKFIAFLISLNR